MATQTGKRAPTTVEAVFGDQHSFHLVCSASNLVEPMKSQLSSLWISRFSITAMLLTIAYSVSMWQPVRGWYSDVDKLAHGMVFSGVYAALAWALRWRPWTQAALALALGAAVEVHQYFLPGFSASFKDWLADAVGIALAGGAHLAWQRWRTPADTATPGGLLPLAQFQQAVAALPLVSVDWVLTNPAGELLVGQRLNAPARGTWFTPGGRIRKGEPLAAALRRVAAEEPGLAGGRAGAARRPHGRLGPLLPRRRFFPHRAHALREPALRGPSDGGRGQRPEL